MARKDELKSDPAFCEAVEGVRTAISILPGLEISDREAEMATTFALAKFTRAGGLSEPSVSRLARFAPDMGAGNDGQVGTQERTGTAPDNLGGE
jgi:hypothetical protein